MAPARLDRWSGRPFMAGDLVLSNDSDQVEFSLGLSPMVFGRLGLQMFIALAALLLIQDPSIRAAEYVSAHHQADQALLAGDGEEAKLQFNRCLELSPTNPTIAYGLACAEASVGNLSRGARRLYQAAQWGYTDYSVAEWDDDLKPLAGLKGFQRAMHLISENANLQVDRYEFVYWSRSYEYEVFNTRRYTDSAVSRNGEFAIAGTTDGCLEWIATKDAKKLGELKLSLSAVTACKFLASGADCVVLTNDGVLHWVGLDSDEQLTVLNSVRALEGIPRLNYRRYEEYVLRPSSTGDRVLVASANGQGAALVNRDGEKLWEGDGQYGFQRHAAVDWNEEVGLIAGIRAGKILFFDDKQGLRYGPNLDFPADATAIAFSPDGKRFCSAHGSGMRDSLLGGRIFVWDLESQKLLHDQVFRDGFSDDVAPVAFSNDGSMIYFGTVSYVQEFVIDAASGERIGVGASHGGTIGSTPATVRWVDGGYYSGRVGGGKSYWVNTTNMKNSRYPADGRVPSVSEVGLLVNTWIGGIALVEANSLQLRWSYSSLNREHPLLQTEPGYFTGDLNQQDLLSLRITWKLKSPSIRNPIRLAASDVADRFYDPKRVRASIAGIKLVPVQIEP